MSPQAYAALCLVCLLGAASPGPSLAVVMGAAIAGGRQAGLAAALAHGLGVAAYALFTVSGLALFMSGAPTLFILMQTLGALYLLYLGFTALRQPGAGPAAAATGITRPARDGFMIAFLNPKLALFMLALFSQFLSPAASVEQKALMVVTAGGIDAAWYALVVLLLSRAPVLAALERRVQWVGRVFALLLIGLGAVVLLQVVLKAAGA